MAAHGEQRLCMPAVQQVPAPELVQRANTLHWEAADADVGHGLKLVMKRTWSLQNRGLVQASGPSTRRWACLLSTCQGQKGEEGCWRQGTAQFCEYQGKGAPSTPQKAWTVSTAVLLVAR